MKKPNDRQQLDKTDPWLSLRRHTAARIALGRAGGSARTQAVLEFRLAHARAKDAVEMQFDAAPLRQALQQAGIENFPLQTQAHDRRSFLLQPDAGRRLDTTAAEWLCAERLRWGARDLCVLVSDGLSALAAERQSVPLLEALWPLLSSLGVTCYPVFIVPYARVKLADEVGELLAARHSLILLGERPGLSSPDSLGAYLTYRPNAARSDADRNCVSNIRPEGLPCAAAAQVLVDLIRESARRGLSGVALKLDAAPALLTSAEELSKD